MPFCVTELTAWPEWSCSVAESGRQILLWGSPGLLSELCGGFTVSGLTLEKWKLRLSGGFLYFHNTLHLALHLCNPLSKSLYSVFERKEGIV